MSRPSLFDTIDERHSNDAEIIAKTKAKKTVTTAKRGGNSLLAKIKAIIDMVNANLGQFAEETLIIRDEQTLHDYISACLNNQAVAIDTETTGLNPLKDTVVGVCLYTEGQKTAYIPLEHINYITLQKEPNQLSREVVSEALQRLVLCKEVIEHNAKFDTRFMRSNFDVNIVCTWDTFICAKLMDENLDYDPAGHSYALKKLHNYWVLDGKGDAFRFDELFKGVDFRYVPIKVAGLYAAHDPKITWELKEWEDKSEMLDDGSRWVFENIEMPCVQILCDMEDNGIKFDFKYNEKLQEKYNVQLKRTRAELYGMLKPYKEEIAKSPKLDDPVNLDSPSQLSILLYDIMKIPPIIDKRTGEPIRSTGADVLKQLDNDFVRALLTYRGLGKLVNTYINKLPSCVLDDGRVHGQFNQYGAVTGRLSSDNPNMQNIPSHVKDIRKMFVASDGYLLMSADFSQQEPKALAALCRKSGDNQMYDTFMAGKDLYSEIASKAFNKPYEECREFDAEGNKNPPEYKERRTQAKSILLGVLYGRGTASVAEQLHTTTENASAIKESVFAGFPAIKRFEEESLAMAHEKGYVTTVCGRRRRLPELQLDDYEFHWKDGVCPYDDPLDFDNDTSDLPVPQDLREKYLRALSRCRFNEKRKVFEKANQEGVWIVDNGGKKADATRQCVNARIQGSAADLTKVAMIELHNNQELKGLGFRILLQVHDEVICECPEQNIKRCSELLAETMSKSAEKVLEMPMKVDVEISREWYGESVEV